MAFNYSTVLHWMLNLNFEVEK